MIHQITSYDDDNNERPIAIEFYDVSIESEWRGSVLLQAYLHSNGKASQASEWFDFDPDHGWSVCSWSDRHQCDHERQAYEAIGLCEDEVRELFESRDFLSSLPACAVAAMDSAIDGRRSA